MGKIFCLSGLEYNFAQAHMAPKTEVHEAQPWKSLNLMDRFCTRRGARKRNRKKHFAPRTCNPASCRPILAQLYFPLRRLRLSYSAGQLVQEAVIARAERESGFYQEIALRSCATSVASALAKHVGGFPKLAALIKARDAEEIRRKVLKRHSAKPMTSLSTLGTASWAL